MRKEPRERRPFTIFETVQQHETETLELLHEDVLQESKPVDSKPEREPKMDNDSEGSETESEDEIFWTPEISPSTFYNRFVEKTPQQALQEMKAPQRSLLWHEARKTCITASQFGSAVGLNPYSTPEGMLIEKLWVPFQGNEATAYGTLHEPCAAASFQQYVKETFSQDHISTEIREYGLLKHFGCPWIGVSPDGILYVINETTKQVAWYVLEYKCPFYARVKADGSHPYSKWRDNVPDYYRAQVLGVSGYLSQWPAHALYDETQASTSWTLRGLSLDKKPSGAFFVVWTPSKTFVTELPFDREAWTSLYDKLKDFYFRKMLPALTHKHNGRLQENSLVATETMHLETE